MRRAVTDGHGVAHVARALGLSENTVRKYRAIVEREGIAGLRMLPLGGQAIGP
ncbi:helix-turn-helix domain-containing protein [Paraburkholderia hospita]|uniref:helix-turn-helix domain-containing protein n=1 Tax=Paraburkholderia hospita TaxID=169430 RepID=UPI003BFA3697